MQNVHKAIFCEKNEKYGKFLQNKGKYNLLIQQKMLPTAVFQGKNAQYNLPNSRFEKESRKKWSKLYFTLKERTGKYGHFFASFLIFPYLGGVDI